jgi:hypothetical protein
VVTADRSEVRLVNASSLLALVRLPLLDELAFPTLALLHRFLFLLMLTLDLLPPLGGVARALVYSNDLQRSEQWPQRGNRLVCLPAAREEFRDAVRRDLVGQTAMFVNDYRAANLRR